MRTDDWAQKKRAEMLDVARLLRADRFDLIEGCRRIVSLAALIELNHPVVGPFVATDSQTDHFPRGEASEQYASDYLARLDREEAEYLAQVRTDIYCACVDLLSHFEA